MDQTFDQMSPAERILYVQDLWDRIAEHPEDVPVSDEMKATLDRPPPRTCGRASVA